MFPATVRPQPGLGSGYDVPFESPGMQFRDLPVGSSGRVFHQQLYMDLVMPSFYLFDCSIYNGLIQLAGYAFRAQENGCILVQEGHPVGVVGVGCLIGNKGGDALLFAQRHHFLEGILPGNELGAEAGPHAVNEAIHIFIDQGMVDHIKLRVDLAAAGIACPFPVAQVPHYQDQALALRRQVVEQFGRSGSKIAVLQHPLFADGQGLEGFQEQVAKVPVKLAPDLLQLLLRLFGESVAEVLHYQLLAVADHPQQEKTENIGKAVQYREG